MCVYAIGNKLLCCSRRMSCMEKETKTKLRNNAIMRDQKYSAQ